MFQCKFGLSEAKWNEIPGKKQIGILVASQEKSGNIKKSQI